MLPDMDTFSLYKAANLSGKNGSQEAVTLIYSCPVPPAGLKQEHDILRCFALDNSVDNYIAMGFSNGRINITKADVESPIKFSRGEDIRDTHTQRTYPV
uniref:Uncharacterized protein n=1 Tax=Ditylenchus dipsaci TaxID=166011 RepID=A0A915E346_9BILA